MRCAARGEPFHALFGWDEVRNEYVLLETVPAENETPKKTTSAEPGVKKPKGIWALVSRFLAFLIGLFAGKRSRGHDRALQARTDEAEGPSNGASGERKLSEFDLSEFNFNGFSCPICGYGDKVPLVAGIHYLQCGNCNELVCGMRLDVIRGSVTFRCHNECGGNGTLGTGPSGPITASGIVGDIKASRRANSAASSTLEGRTAPSETQSSPAIGLPSPGED